MQNKQSPLLTRLATILLVVTMISGGLPAIAQNLFAPVIRVNDRVITKYELSQRMAFLRLLRAQGDIRAQAQKQLIGERLQLDIADRMGIEVTPEDLAVGMAEFAARANLTTEKFVTAIAQGGVAKESYRDFVLAGLAWREVATARFSHRISISQSELNRAIAEGVNTGGGVKPEKLDYAMLYIPGGHSAAAQSEAARIKGDVDSCDDLYAIAKGLPEDRLVRTEAQPGDIPADVALELAWLDAGEVSTALTRGEALVFLMLCARTRALPEGISAAEVKAHLQNQRLNELSTSYLQEVEADAHIEYLNR